METILTQEMARKQDQEIEQTVEKTGGKLFNFIRKQVREVEDAEDIFQDVLFRFTKAFRGIDPIDDTTAWLFRVARNRITDWYRKKKTPSFSETFRDSEDGPLHLEDILPDLSALPDDVFTRNLVWEILEEALQDLPPAQREVFELHEFEGRSFKEIAALKGTTVNTLLSRKRYAVLHLRSRLEEIYKEI